VFRVSATKLVSAIDPTEPMAWLPALLSECRALRFEGGVCVDGAGARREGLRVIEGAHGVPGCRYQLVMEVPVSQEPATASGAERRQEQRIPSQRRRRPLPGEHRAGPRETLAVGPQPTRLKRYELTLVRDDPHVVEVAVAGEASGAEGSIAVDSPGGRPTVRAHAQGVLGGNWLQRGRFTASGRSGLGDLPPHRSTGPQAEASFRHRLFRGGGSLHIRGRGERWEAQVRLRLGGRGVLR
jgi:hypothetical protein